LVEWWHWVLFVAFLIVMLALDLFVFHRKAHAVSSKEAALFSAFWISLGLAFAGIIWAWQGGDEAGEYLAGYLIEKSLSVDNVFVFVLIFSYFAVPKEYQHRVLFWGVVGALLMRAGFIAAGAALIETFHWVIYVFGAFLVFTGIKMFRHEEMDLDADTNPVLRTLRRFLPVSQDYDGQRFFTKRNGVRMATPLFAVLVLIETSDLIFAVDSIPAIFAVTTDTFLVFTSNAFAILGLRALYFLLADLAGRFAYLKVGLAFILVFVGVKMLITDVYHFPVWGSLGVIAAILSVAILASLLKKSDEPLDEQAVADPFGLLTRGKPRARGPAPGD
jgi:tellurite resistance protein TerC